MKTKPKEQPSKKPNYGKETIKDTSDHQRDHLSPMIDAAFIGPPTSRRKPMRWWRSTQGRPYILHFAQNPHIFFIFTKL